MLWVFAMAVGSIILVAILMHRVIILLRATFISGEISAQAANCALLSLCLLVTWAAILQACIDVVRGDSLSGLLGVFVFFVGLSFLLYKRVGNYKILSAT